MDRVVMEEQLLIIQLPTTMEMPIVVKGVMVPQVGIMMPAMVAVG
jgi:hypothetical protein